MSTPLNIPHWIEKHERRLKAMGIVTPSSPGLRLRLGEMVRVNRRLERKLARLERNRPVEMRRKFEAAERLVVMVRASLDGRLVGDEEMRREVERFERV